jgi:hypothetical protein
MKYKIDNNNDKVFTRIKAVNKMRGIDVSFDTSKVNVKNIDWGQPIIFDKK